MLQYHDRNSIIGQESEVLPWRDISSSYRTQNRIKTLSVAEISTDKRLAFSFYLLWSRGWKHTLHFTPQKPQCVQFLSCSAFVRSHHFRGHDDIIWLYHINWLSHFICEGISLAAFLTASQVNLCRMRTGSLRYESTEDLPLNSVSIPQFQIGSRVCI